MKLLAVFLAVAFMALAEGSLFQGEDFFFETFKQ